MARTAPTPCPGCGRLGGPCPWCQEFLRLLAAADPAAPTAARPGSLHKQAVLAARAHARRPLWDPGDPVLRHGDSRIAPWRPQSATTLM